MPCNSEHMEPNAREREQKRAAGLLVWVKTKMGKTVPEYAKKAAADYYGNGGDRAIRELCTLLGQTHPTRLQKFFDEHTADPTAHEARAWWAQHQADDAAKVNGNTVLDLGLNANDVKLGGKLIRR